jgi:hypothetical protein
MKEIIMLYAQMLYVNVINHKRHKSSLEVDSRLLTINRLLRDFFLKVDQLSTVVGFFFLSRQLVNFLEKSKLLQDLGSAT